MTEHTPPIDPARTVLLVMDYQPAIVDSLDGRDELLGRTAEVLALARRRGVTVGYVRVAFSDADYDAIPATNKSFSGLAGARRLPESSPASAVHPTVAPAPGDIVVRKTRVGAFSTTDLDTQLRARGIDTLVLAGIATSGVVLSTVRDGADRDYRLYVLGDCCADRDAEVHQLLIEKVFPRQAFVITSASLSTLIPRA